MRYPWNALSDELRSMMQRIVELNRSDSRWLTQVDSKLDTLTTLVRQRTEGDHDIATREYQRGFVDGRTKEAAAYEQQQTWAVRLVPTNLLLDEICRRRFSKDTP